MLGALMDVRILKVPGQNMLVFSELGFGDPWEVDLWTYLVLYIGCLRNFCQWILAVDWR